MDNNLNSRMTVTRDLSGGDSKMRKILMVGIIAFAMIASAGLVSAATTFHTGMHGNNVDFDIYTHTTHAYDHFHGDSDGALNVDQTVQIGSTSQWASDGEDIDRYGDFSGNGKLTTVSEWDSLGTHSWDWGHSTQYSGVISDDTGYLGQNLHFGSNWGGVNDVDNWKKQRDMNIGAESNYEIYFGARDERANNWEFDFTAIGTGDAGLHVDSSYSTYQHNPGPPYYGPFDGYHVAGERGNPYGYAFQWTGDVIGDIYARGERGVDYEEYGDFVNGFIFGNVEIW